MKTQAFHQGGPGRYGRKMSDPSPTQGLSLIAIMAILFAALAGLAGVGLGAWATHGAPAGLRAAASTAALYAMIHGLALAVIALIHDRTTGSPAARWAFRLSMLAFALGIVLFTGGIVLATGTTPHGGVLLIAGWGVLALGSAILLLKALKP